MAYSKEEAIAGLAASQAVTLAHKAEKYKDWINGNEIVNIEPKEFDWLVQSLFQRTGLVVLYGLEDLGKSTLLRQFVLCLTSGKPWVGFAVNPKYGKALFISTEDDKEAMQVTMPKQAEAIGYDKNISKNIFFLFKSFQIIEEIKTILAEAKKNDTGFDAIVIDCFGDVFNLNSSQQNQVRVWLSEFYDVSRKYEILIVWNHHSKKNTENKVPNKRNASGAGITAKSRAAIELRKDPSEDHIRHFCITKGNYIPDEMKQQSIALDFRNDCFTVLEDKSLPFESIKIIVEERLERYRKWYDFMHTDGVKTKTQEQAAEEFSVTQRTIGRGIKVWKEELKSKKESDNKK